MGYVNPDKPIQTAADRSVLLARGLKLLWYVLRCIEQMTFCLDECNYIILFYIMYRRRYIYVSVKIRSMQNIHMHFLCLLVFDILNRPEGPRKDLFKEVLAQNVCMYICIDEIAACENTSDETDWVVELLKRWTFFFLEEGFCHNHPWHLWLVTRSCNDPTSKCQSCQWFSFVPHGLSLSDMARGYLEHQTVDVGLLLCCGFSGQNSSTDMRWYQGGKIWVEKRTNNLGR